MAAGLQQLPFAAVNGERQTIFRARHDRQRRLAGAVINHRIIGLRGLVDQNVQFVGRERQTLDAGHRDAAGGRFQRRPLPVRLRLGAQHRKTELNTAHAQAGGTALKHSIGVVTATNTRKRAQR